MKPEANPLCLYHLITLSPHHPHHGAILAPIQPTLSRS